MSETATNRCTNEELAGRIHYAAGLLLQGAPPAIVLSRCVEMFGVSIRTARRYLANAAEMVREDGITDKKDPFSQTAHLAMQRLQDALLEATPKELPRLISSLAKLREVMAADQGPALSDQDLIHRSAFVGGMAKLGEKEGPEPWDLED